MWNSRGIRRWALTNQLGKRFNVISDLYPCFHMDFLFQRNFSERIGKIRKASRGSRPLLRHLGTAIQSLRTILSKQASIQRGIYHCNLPVGRVVTRSCLEWEDWGSNLGPVKLDTVLAAARHRCNISSKGAVLPGRSDVDMGPANSLHAWVNIVWFELT